MASLRLISELVIPSRRLAAASRIFRARSTATAGFAPEAGMGGLLNSSYVHSIEYMFRILNSCLQLFRGSRYQWVGSTEHVFNILNTLPRLGKYSPLVCKFLDIVTGIVHAGVDVARCGS